MSTVWKADPGHSVVEFSVKHLMITTVRGRFKEFDITLTGDPENLTGASVDVSINAASIDTSQPDRDAHLKSADLFDVEKYPKITFKSTKIVSTGQNEYDVTGDLTIRDKTHPVTLKVTYEGSGKDPWGGTRASFSASGKIDRTAFGVSWNAPLETGGVLVSNEVKLNFELQFVRQ